MIEPTWLLFYTHLLKTTIQTCPCNTFLKLHPTSPLHTLHHQLQCTVLNRDTHSITTPFPPLCVIAQSNQNIVHTLYKTIYEVAKQGTVRSVPFENGTCVHIGVKSSTSALTTVTLWIDPDRPPNKSFTHFDNVSACQATKRFVEATQQHQHIETHPSFVTNPRFSKLPIDQWYAHVPNYPQRMCFDQLHYTAGDWSDLWYHAMYSSYTRMQSPQNKCPRTLRPKVKQTMQYIEQRFLGKDSPYFELSPATTLRTLRYMFQKQQKGVFVRIRNNTLDMFLPFLRYNFTNDYYHKLHLPNTNNEHAEDHRELQQLRQYESQLREWDSMMDSTDPLTIPSSIQEKYKKTLQAFLHLEYQCAVRYAKRFPPNVYRPHEVLKKNPNRRQWHANNHFFNTSVYYDLPNVHHFYYLLQQLVKHRKALPDVEFVLMLRDYPVLRTSKSQGIVTIHQPFPNVEKPENTLQMQCTGGLTPILSHTGKDGYDDIPLPTVDDIEHFEQTHFLMKCNASNIVAKDSTRWVEWKDKAISQAVFRGSATGQGTTTQTNLRLKVKRIANETRYKHLFDVELHALNTKVKVAANVDGLQLLDYHGIQQQLSSGIKKHFLPTTDRAKYKYNLVLDGHTRADRLGNELCLGSLVILPTTDGHRLWLEPFLRPLRWEELKERKSAPTVQEIQKHKYTHVTIDNVDDIGELVRWFTNHDALAEAVVHNARQWLHHDGFYRRFPPTTNFLYDYMEGVVRALAKRNACSKSHPYTLVPSNHTILKSIRPKSNSKTKSKPSARTAATPTVGLVVGFRDSESNTRSDGGIGVRTQQLKQFCDYFDLLFPSSWKRVVVVAEQATVPDDRRAFDVWWSKVIGDTANEITLYEYIHRLQTAQQAHTLPPCLQRNATLVQEDCVLMCGVDKQRLELCRTVQWTRDECYRRTAEQKFNLGILKNAGYAYLRKTFSTKLSHVIFTDIDMLPDHELAAYYIRPPRANELIALATRGTVYEPFRIDAMPSYTLLSKPHANNKDISSHTRHRFHTQQHTQRTRHRGGHQRMHSRKYRRHHNNKKHTHHHRRHSRTHSHTQTHAQSHFNPRTNDGKPCVPMWMSSKFKRFVGAAVSFSPTLFESINGYPNNFWGWGGEDDELLNRLHHQNQNPKKQRVVYTVPEKGRLIDLEMAQPVTKHDKLAHRVKELQKLEKLSQSQQTWQNNGWKQLDAVSRTTVVKAKLRKNVVRLLVHCA